MTDTISAQESPSLGLAWHLFWSIIVIAIAFGLVMWLMDSRESRYVVEGRENAQSLLSKRLDCGYQ